VDRIVTECEPELEVCYKGDSYHVVKDIRVDKGVYTKHKFIFEEISKMPQIEHVTRIEFLIIIESKKEETIIENQDSKAYEMSDEISCSQLTFGFCPEHLLEAAVTTVCHNNNILDNEVSFSTSVKDAVVSGRKPEVSIHNVRTINLERYSVDQSPDTQMVKDRSQVDTKFSSYPFQKDRLVVVPSANDWMRISCRPVTYPLPLEYQVIDQLNNLLN
jgi:hypothetical protein